MGTSLFYRSGCKLGLLGVALVLGILPGTAHADEIQAQQAVGAPYAAPIARLQVTGNAEKYSVDADHADAHSVLKAIFDQANAQFTTDNSVVGQVTMRLTGQTLTATLDAVCKQLLIRYHKDPKDIFVFEQDMAATKAAIARIQELNGSLRQQLRAFGLSVPEDAVLDGVSDAVGAGAAVGKYRAVSQPPTNSAGGLGAGRGGFGGGGAAKTPDIKTSAPDAGNQGGRSLPVPRSVQRDTSSKADIRMRLDNGVADRGAQNSLLGNLNYLSAQDLTEIFALNPQKNELQNPNNYRAFLQQNGLVYINTGGQKEPVTEVLQELGRQSNTRILIDPSVPIGPKFNLQGYITPRTLPEALNVLTQSTRLNWRWLGASVYVNALPDFQLFFNSTTPRVIFGSNAYPTQQGNGQGQQQFNNNGVYAQPAQTPLPITNGEKKTP
jgi:hypothetical protein